MRKHFQFLRNLIFYFLVVLVLLPSQVYATSISVTGKASVLNTGNTYLDFGGYNSNVVIDNTSGNFSGYAFLEDAGWVSFGTTDNAQGPVNVSLTTGLVTGVAKVLNTSANIDFSSYNSNVAVNTTTGVFSGFAFSEDYGWLSFSNTGVNTGGTALVTSGSNSSSSSSNSSAPTCSTQTPSSAPNLYATTAQNSSSITLYFTDAGQPTDHYVLSYGLSTGSFQWGQDNIGSYGTKTYTVKGLAPGTAYQFRLRGGNGCAAGTWSNTLSTTTKGLASFNQLKISKSELVPFVGEKKTEENQNKMFGEKPTVKTYSLSIKVVDENGKPVEGAKITIHSDVKEATTDKDGIAHFEEVETGEHRVLIVYSGFKGEQSINLTGDAKELSLNLTVKPQTFVFSSAALVIISILIMIIFGLIFYVLRLRRKSRSS